MGLGVAVVAVARAERERRAAASAAPAGRPRENRPVSRLQGLTLEQLDLAIALLQGRASTPPAQTVHETRKTLKRARALVRLQRSSLGPKRYARESGALRHAARQLAGARDAEVMVEALDALVRRHPKRLAHSGGVRALRARLAAERDRSSAHSAGSSHLRAQVAEELRVVRARLERWTPRKSDRKVAREGLRRLYRQGARRGRRARKAQSSVALHQWRGRAKDLRYVAEMLDGRDKQQRRRLRRVAQLADRLGETLGEEHDLALLAEQVRANRDCFKSQKPARKALERQIARRRAGLRARAWQLGERLYRRPPGRFVGRLLGG